jgi:tetrahydromethanopterin S-methyltransferase subunit H
MTAQGWRKRQISDQIDQTTQEARIQILEEENIDLKSLLMHAHYFVAHYGKTNVLTDREQQARDSFLDTLTVYLSDPIKKAPEGL